ncbi:MAG: hypothetical protein CFE40_04600 [Burkholderiales bacterium PBB1]|nr:MAG: hypothetical protein CFE40_04600 [Burkholderiales bacterium PBB1]
MVMLALLVSGCGELSYKRGASTQDLEAAKKSCQSAGSEKAAERCLEDQGWTVKKLDDVDLFATAGVSPDNRNPSAFITPEFVPVVPAQSAAPAPSAVAAAAAAGPATDKPVVPPVSPPPPSSPLDVYTISSWWKMGADREALAADTLDCVATLGPAHKPNETTQQVTRGFVVCMHAKGWKALRAVAG